MTVRIRASGDYYCEINSGGINSGEINSGEIERGETEGTAALAQPPELKGLVKEAIGQPIRRIGRFIQLALIGAGRCVGEARLPADTGGYLASGRGDLEVTLEVMEQLFRHGQPPKPLTFINSVSNSACFYVARQFGLRGRSSFVCNRYFAFESALQLALEDLAAGRVRSALVGGVDMVVAPLADHRRRLELAPGEALAEGSHWLWLVAEDEGGAAPALVARHCADRDALLAWIAAQALAVERCHLSAGQFLDPAELALIEAETGLWQRFDYRAGRGYYDSHSGAVLGEFERRHAAGDCLLHINGDPDGRFSALLSRI
jgi:hypothetical protein